MFHRLFFFSYNCIINLNWHFFKTFSKKIISEKSFFFYFCNCYWFKPAEKKEKKMNRKVVKLVWLSKGREKKELLWKKITKKKKIDERKKLLYFLFDFRANNHNFFIALFLRLKRKKIKKTFNFFFFLILFYTFLIFDFLYFFFVFFLYETLQLK